MEIFTLKNGENITEKEIGLIISNFLIEIIEKNIPHKWVGKEEPFHNIYNGRISYDYSGEVVKMSIIDFKNILTDYSPNFIYVSELDMLFQEIYINRWEPSYESNRGKNWISYKDILEEKYNEWKYESFELYDDDGNYTQQEEADMEDVDIKLDELLQDFLTATSIDLYYAKIFKFMQSTQ